jgi:hypothetical protein
MSLVTANFGRSAQEPDLQVVRTEVRPTIQSVNPSKLHLGECCVVDSACMQRTEKEETCEVYRVQERTSI